MDQSQFKVGDRVLYGKLRCVVAACSCLNGEWRYSLSDRVDGEIYFENIPQDQLREIED